jgi:hypothetical protein
VRKELEAGVPSPPQIVNEHSIADGLPKNGGMNGKKNNTTQIEKGAI